MTGSEQTRLLPSAQEAPGLHAGFWRRVAAYIIDALILDVCFIVLWFVVAAIMGVALFSQGENQSAAAAFGFTLAIGLLEVGFFVATWLYFALFESSRLQATPGKLALGLAVTDEFGKRIGFGRATGRFFGKILSSAILDIGFMMAGWTARKQALHDMLAGTCVVQKTGLANLSAPDSTQPPPAAGEGAGMPGWGVALIGVGVAFFALAVIAIIAAISIPLYLNYADRAQASEAVHTGHDLRDRLVAYRRKFDDWPSTERLAQYNVYAKSHALAGQYTRYARVDDCAGLNCTITVRLRSSLASGSMAGKTPRIWARDGGQTWYCGAGGRHPLEQPYLPPDCRDRGANLSLM
jgi:uncharacterized RDD family membrane protein YckC/type II secretory pathway pseudopilin PulG